MNTQKERPILFKGEMVRAILDSKTQTRRIAKAFDGFQDMDKLLARFPNQEGCPYGKPGELLWVRETHRYWWPDNEDPGSNPCRCRYKADDAICDLPVCWDEGPFFNAPECHRLDVEPAKWRPSIFMPRWASRILLEIIAVRVERLQSISEADARAEGAPPSHQSIDHISHAFGYADFSRSWYAQLWESINGPGSWAANPWVWAVEFRRVQP